MRFINSAMTLMGRKTVKGRTTSAPKTVSKTAKSTTATADGASIEPGVTTASAHPPKSAPSHDDIARRSYELFLARGGEPGHEMEDWLTAERELSG